MRDRFHWARLLAFVTGLVNQDLLLRNEYLIAENRILRGHLPMRLRLADPERVTLAEIAKRLGRKALKDVAQVAKPDCVSRKTRSVRDDGSCEFFKISSVRQPERSRFWPPQSRHY